MKNAAKIASSSREKIPFAPSALTRRMGANIKAIRESKIGSDGKRLTLAEMARHLWGSKPTYLAKIEAGNSNITVSKMIQIAAYLGLGENVYRLFLPPGAVIIEEGKK